jgi:hypothetical protein
MREDFLNCNISTHIFKKNPRYVVSVDAVLYRSNVAMAVDQTLMGAVVVVIVW